VVDERDVEKTITENPGDQTKPKLLQYFSSKMVDDICKNISEMVSKKLVE